MYYKKSHKEKSINFYAPTFECFACNDTGLVNNSDGLINLYWGDYDKDEKGELDQRLADRRKIYEYQQKYCEELSRLEEKELTHDELNELGRCQVTEDTPFGEVMNCSLPLERDTGRKRGFAFVEMADESIESTAIDGLQGAELMGRPLRINKAEPRGGGD